MESMARNGKIFIAKIAQFNQGAASHPCSSSAPPKSSAWHCLLLIKDGEAGFS